MSGGTNRKTDTLNNMLRLNIANNADEIVVTLKEKTTIADANYLFVFENITTKEKVQQVFLSSDDLSLYPFRYNKYTIDTASIFTGKSVGQWLYKVYEQAGTATDETGLTEVENGRMELLTVTGETYKKYSPATTFKTYNG